MAELPTGTVTFLITDLEGSTRLWEQQPDTAMRDALAGHDAVFHEAVERNRGVVYDTAGDGVLAVFESAVDAVAAALEAQQQFTADAGMLRARIGLHSDEGFSALRPDAEPVSDGSRTARPTRTATAPPSTPGAPEAVSPRCR